MIKKLKIKELTKEFIVFDAHVDTALAILAHKSDLIKNSKLNQVDIPKLKKGNVKIVIFAAFVDPKYNNYLKRAIKLLEAIINQVNKYSQYLQLITNSKNLTEVLRNNKIGIILGVEGGHVLENKIEILEQLYSLGVRVLTLTWMNNNYFADASGEIPKWNGLNSLGIEVVKKMNELGMIIDLSHASDKTFYDVLKYTSKPVILSHSGVRSICNFHRNASDEMLKELAKNNGVIGIPFSPVFLSNEFNDGIKVIEANYNKDSFKNKRKFKKFISKETIRLFNIGVSKLVDHIDYVVNTIGIDYVGLGSDFDGITYFLKDLENASKISNITEELLLRNYSNEDIKKILAYNFIRVVKANL